MTPAEYDAFIAERADEIRARIRRAVSAAAMEIFEDEAIAAKYLTPEDDGDVVRLGFRDGLGFEIRVAEAYRPTAVEGVTR